jgi:hypothetical protein
MGLRDSVIGLFADRRIVLFIGILTLSTFVVTLVLFLGQRSRMEISTIPLRTVKTESDEVKRLMPSDFVMAEEELVSLDNRRYPFRPRIKEWSPAQVKKFWIPVRDILLDLISRKNDRLLEEILEKIP